MRRWCYALACGFVLLTGEAVAQEALPATLQTMTVSIKPEYDKSSVLVIYRGTLDENAPLPSEIRLLVPKNADVTDTCALTPNGEHKCQLAQFTEQADGKEVRFPLPERTFTVELYYDPGFEKSERRFTYSIVSPHPIRYLEIEAQKPLRSTDFQTEPAAQSSTDSEGFEVRKWAFHDAKPGQSFLTTVGYQKTDDRPSVESKSSKTPVEKAINPTSSNSKAMPLVAGGVLVGMVALGFGFYWARSVRGTPRSEPRNTAPSGGKFCPMCGKKMQPAHRFCSNCGSSLRGD